MSVSMMRFRCYAMCFRWRAILIMRAARAIWRRAGSTYARAKARAQCRLRFFDDLISFTPDCFFAFDYFRCAPAYAAAADDAFMPLRAYAPAMLF